ncbi:putative OPT family oligopeptide transporter [Sporomusaceae bacterium BoRhaA]|uniref:OPT family oligopeptide transporter n=1 Tax=Pelorhabdus rhamnosifermentans TaxID=2772457 RepID=UPI001C0619AB|nr:oligopeptide transporter, OPT family [Pelorhabdus rhamnosifermentans]MBU2699850.1 putative OPT family oligopeptide transporter [Pelorhabdus rhamnosifermentans]
MSENKNDVISSEPPMSPHKEYQEINSYVVFWGLFYAAIFALAVGYLCLKIGQTVDAFAPVSVMAMGMAVMLKRKNAFPENVHIQAIASAGTNGIGGAMFILPAFYILGNDHLSYFQLAVPIILGSLLGVLIAAIFRRYFCEEMHHAYPFPQGRAAAEVLTSGEGSKAKLMVFSGAVALIYDFILNSLGWWQEVISSATFSWGQQLADKAKLTFSLDNESALLGIGYFTGLRYAAIITAGSFFSWFVCIPVIYYLAGDHHMLVNGKDILLATAPIPAVFREYVRHIGIGMLAMAGVIGLLSMSKVVANVVKVIMAGLFKKNDGIQQSLQRTQKDIPMPLIVSGIIGITFLFTVFFHIFFAQSALQTLVAMAIVLVFTFLFSVVGISSIAFTGTEPVSGMTIFMLIVSAVVLGSTGMHGNSGITAILMMAAFLCTTLGVAGNFMSELKVAHLLGATPRKMQQWQLVSATLTGVLSIGVLLLLNQAYGFVGPGALPAPQANAMAVIIQPLMENGTAHWPLYLAGGFFAIILWMLKVPPLAFALGAYLPMEINTPLLVGGLISYFVSHSSKEDILNSLRFNQGQTIASGFIAGGAIGSLISAILRIAGFNYFLEKWVETPAATYLGVLFYLLLCALLYKKAMNAKPASNDASLAKSVSN